MDNAICILKFNKEKSHRLHLQLILYYLLFAFEIMYGSSNFQDYKFENFFEHVFCVVLGKKSD